MASLYIKDNETAALVARVSKRLGKTKTEVVREAVAKVEAETVEVKTIDWLTWIERRRKEHPLPPATGQKADKAFFDELWGEVD